MLELIFATGNKNKVREIQHAIGNSIHVVPMQEAGIDIDIPEPYDTLQENASTKSKTIHDITSKNCFSEDTGLEVYALNGEPGVKSARYSGDGKDFAKNVEKLLFNLKGVENRKARFRTVISLIWGEKEYFFEGVCEGSIIEVNRGEEGFGYDPVFVPDGSEKTFAEMTLDEKNSYSHRKKAADQLIRFLKSRASGQ